ncbi:MAG TPA: hypothetical protein VFN46_08425 [Acetobacteraceae bacterium]|nr:hypothetical protein [Acetobacteraceae bacterium]
MTTNIADMQGRLASLLPLRWFADDAPVLSSLLAGLADGWAWLSDMLAYAKLQTRIATATDTFLDLVSQDCFAAALPRRTGESDAAFRGRIQQELLRERATRPALVAVLTDLTGRVPVVFEPARPADTGAYGTALGYGVAGGWGSLALPSQSFVTAFRPLGAGVPVVGGWGSGAGGWGVGAIEYASRPMVEAQVSDADITAAVARSVPVATIAWLRISD